MRLPPMIALATLVTALLCATSARATVVSDWNAAAPGRGAPEPVIAQRAANRCAGAGDRAHVHVRRVGCVR